MKKQTHFIVDFKDQHGNFYTERFDSFAAAKKYSSENNLIITFTKELVGASPEQQTA